MTESVVAHAPGRVNLIGDHTDYQDGWALPFAIDLGITIRARPREDSEVVLTTDAPVEPGWERYPLAVVEILRREGLAPVGFTGRVESDLPVGSGLASSAALLVATALTARISARIAGGGIPAAMEDPWRLAGLCREAEAEAVGVRCGIMDPFASLKGRAGHGILLDCRRDGPADIPLSPGSVSFLVAHSGVPRALASGAYNRRREECEEAVRLLRDQGVDLRSLGDLDPRRLAATELPPPLDRRARHVVTENERVFRARDALREGDLVRLGRLLYESHESLRTDYEVSGPELDALVEIASELPGVFGSRLTGAGFGGCTVTAVAPRRADSVREALAEEVRRRTGRVCDIREVRPSDGATVEAVP